MRKTLLTSFCLLTALSSMAQDFGKSSTVPLEVVATEDVFSRMKGTYEVQYEENAKKLLITEDLLHQLEQSRKKDQDSVIEYAEGVRIIVYSDDKVKSNSNNSSN